MRSASHAASHALSHALSHAAVIHHPPLEPPHTLPTAHLPTSALPVAPSAARSAVVGRGGKGHRLRHVGGRHRRRCVAAPRWWGGEHCDLLVGGSPRPPPTPPPHPHPHPTPSSLRRSGAGTAPPRICPHLGCHQGLCMARVSGESFAHLFVIFLSSVFFFFCDFFVIFCKWLVVGKKTNPHLTVFSLSCVSLN